MQLERSCEGEFVSLMVIDNNSSYRLIFKNQQLMPMWTPVFRSYQGQLAGHLQVRLQACVNWQPPARVRERPRPMNGGASAGGQQASGVGHGHRTVSSPMLRWLQKVQFKMTQIETQSSAATQFYTM